MKIEIRKIPAKGLILEEELDAPALDLETDLVKLCSSVTVAAEIFKITNTVTVNLKIKTVLAMSCSRCLDEFTTGLAKNLQLSYAVEPLQQFIDLATDIREQIILDYSIKPLCRPDCRGLCPRCGQKINKGGCSCGSTKKKTL